ncbi:hypothetical protein ACVWYQ_006400 [Bradyrhizobium sp. USDA 3397]
MIQGIRLTLMSGPGTPLPVPRDVLDALDSVQVNTYSGDTQSGFELSFSLDKRSSVHTVFLITAGAMPPLLRVIIAITLNGTTDVLIDGVVTHVAVAPGNAAEPSMLKVRGKDLSAAMTLLDFSGVPYPAMTPAARVLLVLAKYAWLGIVPMVIPGIVEDLPIPVERIPRHQGSDFDYVQKLAREAGYVFYMRTGNQLGLSFAYWGPEVRVGAPQPALNVDMDAHTNVESLSFTFDKEKKELPVIFIQETVTKAPIPIPIPDISPLNPPLGLIPPLPPRVQPLNDTAQLSPLQAIMRGLAYAAQHSDAVFADGTVDVLRYGRVLKSRELVGVRGAGPAFDGLYYVKSVAHNLKRGEYKQRFSLARNALVSTLPRVPV